MGTVKLLPMLLFISHAPSPITSMPWNLTAKSQTTEKHLSKRWEEVIATSSRYLCIKTSVVVISKPPALQSFFPPRLSFQNNMIVDFCVVILQDCVLKILLNVIKTFFSY